MNYFSSGGGGSHSTGMRTEAREDSLEEEAGALSQDDCPMRHGVLVPETHLLLPSLPGLFFTLTRWLIAAVAPLSAYYTQPGACYEGIVFIGLNLTLVFTLPSLSQFCPRSR